MNASYNPILDEHGKVAKVVIHATDVSYRVFTVTEVVTRSTYASHYDLRQYRDLEMRSQNNLDPGGRIHMAVYLDKK